MALWGKTANSDEAKPKYLTAAQKKNTFADSRGWVYTQPSGLEEVLVSIGGLSTTLSNATVSAVSFVTTSFSETAGGNIDIQVTYNEKVTVDTSGGTPTITITNSQAGSGSSATVSAAYQSGSSTNKLVFRHTQAADDGSTTNGIAATDVLSVVVAQNIALNSGTIKDAGTATNSGVALVAADGTLTASV
jgi:trimeric autotransporter adhesin